MKNQRDGKISDNINFTIAINIFPIVVNTKKNIIRSSFFNFLNCSIILFISFYCFLNMNKLDNLIHKLIVLQLL